MNETNRYHRQMLVKEISASGQEKLQAAHIAIVGVGGLGSAVSLYLAGAGVGKITLIEADTVSLSNLHRQVLYREDDIGKPKVQVAQKALSARNRDITVIAHQKRLSTENIDDLLADIDVIVDAGDNFSLSYLLSDFAVAQQTPLVSASVLQTNGYLGVYAFSTATQQPCPSLRAIFPEPPPTNNANHSGGIIGTVAGILGTLQAQEVIKVILADPAQLAGRLLNLDLWHYRQSIIDFNEIPNHL